jgi:broad specificity phosphatase PhoE
VRFVLAKHAHPVVIESQPASTWVLSDEGRDGAAALGSSLRSLVTRVISSTEPKAAETATIAASVIGIETDGAFDGFREHLRESAGYLGADEFDAAIRAVFNAPDEPVFADKTADETGAEATERFARTLDDVVTDGTLVVAHGTVISLWCAAHCGVDGHALWKRLGLPSYVVVEDGRVATVVGRVT